MTLRVLIRLCLLALMSLPPLPVAAEDSMVATTRLNVRAGPGLDSDILDTLSPGERVLAGTCRDNWCPITHVGPDGWVYAPYLVAAGFKQSWNAVSGDLPATLADDGAIPLDLDVTIEAAPKRPCPPGRPFC